MRRCKQTKAGMIGEEMSLKSGVKLRCGESE